MKSRLFLLGILVFAFSSMFFGQVPRTMSHQGYLAKSTGEAVDTTMNMTFRFFADSTEGSALWEQSFTDVIVTKGIFQVNLGPFPSELTFSQQYWLETEAGGEVISPRTRLTSNAYALRADAANVADAVNPAANLNANTLTLWSSGTNFQVENGSTFYSRNSLSNYEAFLWPRWVDNAMYMNYGTGGLYIRNNASANTMFMSNDNNVGIGMTSPYAKLDVRKDWSTYAARITNLNPGSTLGLYVNSYGNNPSLSGYRYGIESDVGYAAYSYAGYFYAYAGGGVGSYGIYAYAGGGTSYNYAGMFSGNVVVYGTLSKSAGSFKIDHPLDPAHKYLSHSFVESPDMMNIYNGNVTVDASGEATVQLPDWFEALNKDFRYQLTAVGAPGPNLYISQKIENNKFKISGGQQGMEVSWQVTGVRKDAYAEKHRILVEENKTGDEDGRYIFPELFGASKEKGIQYLHQSKAKVNQADN